MNNIPPVLVIREVTADCAAHFCVSLPNSQANISLCGLSGVWSGVYYNLSDPDDLKEVKEGDLPFCEKCVNALAAFYIVAEKDGMAEIVEILKEEVETTVKVCCPFCGEVREHKIPPVNRHTSEAVACRKCWNLFQVRGNEVL